MSCTPTVVLVTNDIAVRLNFRIKRTGTLSRYFRFLKEDGDYLDLTGLSPVMIIYSGGVEVGRYEIGSGFSIYGPDPTRLLMIKQENQKLFPPGTFQLEMRIPTVGYMWEGVYVSVQNLI